MVQQRKRNRYCTGMDKDKRQNSVIKTKENLAVFYPNERPPAQKSRKRYSKRQDWVQRSKSDDIYRELFTTYVK